MEASQFQPLQPPSGDPSAPKADEPRIVELHEIPDFSTFDIPAMTGANGGFTLEQRYIVKFLYQPKWCALNESNSCRTAESAWKAKALKEILELRDFSNVYNQPPVKRLSSQWDNVSLRFL